MRLVRFVLSFCCVIAFSIAAEFDFTVEVPAGRMGCYFQPIIEQHHAFMEIDYQVIDGGDLNINFFVTSPQGAVLQQDVRKMDNTHKLATSMKGDYQLCFDNTFSYQARKLVFFEIFLTDAQGNYQEANEGTLNNDENAKLLAQFGVTMENFEQKMDTIKQNMNKAEHFQALLKAYEARDRAIVETNFSRVNFWSTANSIVLMVVGLIQVFMIRSLFEDKSAVGRFIRKGPAAN